MVGVRADCHQRLTFYPFVFQISTFNQKRKKRLYSCKKGGGIKSSEKGETEIGIKP